MDLSKLIAKQIKDLDRNADAMDAIAEVWLAECPKMLAKFEQITSRGVLIVRIQNAAHRFLVGIQLRGGLESRLIRAGKGKVKVVRIQP